jgi:S1-C subfamily serine protease
LTVQLVPEKNVFNVEMIRRKLGLNLEWKAEGLIIAAVETNSPAATAGLLAGMQVKKVDDQSPATDATALAKIIYAKKSGESVHLEVAAWQQSGAFNVLRQGSVELLPR